MPIYARTQFSARRRQRGAGIEILIVPRMVETEAITLIHEIAASVNMRAILTPITSGEDGGEGNG